jgi:hypothetical protein
MAVSFEDIILRFQVENDEGRDALTDLYTALEALGLVEANPEVELEGVREAQVDLGKLVALLKTTNAMEAQPVIRPRTAEARRAIELFARSLSEFGELEAEIRPEVDTSSIKDAQEQLNRLERKLRRQRNKLAEFTASEQFSPAGGKVRAGKIRETEKELEAARFTLEKLKREAAQGIEVKMTHLQASTALELLRRRLEELGKLLVKPEVRLESEQAQLAASRIRAIMQEITRMKGRANIDLHDEEFQKKIRSLRNEMARLEAELVRPGVDLDGVEETDDQVKHIIATLRLLGAEEADPSINLQGETGTLAGIAAVMQAMRELERRDVNVEIVNRTQLTAGSRAVNVLRNIFYQAQEAATGFGDRLGSVGVRVLGFSFTLGAASLAVITLMAALALLVVGGIAALASSAIIAAGGVGVLATALVGSLLPGALLAFAALSRLSAIMEVLKAREQARKQTAKEALAAEAGRSAAVRSVADALAALERANENVADATVDANREMEDSYERVSDAIRSVERAQLSLDEAKLGVEEAKLSLRELREELGLAGNDISEMFQKFTDVDIQFDPKQVAALMQKAGVATDERDHLDIQRAILNIRQAKLREEEATDGLSDAERELKRAREDNLKFQREGIRASERLAAAMLAQEEATKRLARAQEDLARNASMDAAEAQFAELSKQEQRVLLLFEKIRTSFRRAMAPAISPLFLAFILVLERIPGALDAISPGMERLGDALATVLSKIGNFLTSDFAVDWFNDMADGLARLSGPAGDVLINLLTILMNFSRAAMPALVDLAGRFADKLGEWAAWTADGENMDGLIKSLVENLELWLSIAYELSRVFIGFLMAAEGPGRGFAESLRDALQNLANLLADKEGRQQVTDWLYAAVEATKNFAEAAADLAIAIGSVSDDVSSVTGILPTLTGQIDLFWDAISSGGSTAQFAVRLWDRTMGKAFGEERWAQFKQTVKDFFTGLVTGFFNLAADAWTAGQNLVDGFFGGIKDRWEKGKKGFKNLLKGIATAPLGIFKMGSPSKLFADYGKNVIRGFENGLQSRAAGLGSLLESSLQVPVPTIPTGRLQTAAAGGGGGDIYNDNKFFVQSPAGTAPDTETFIAQVDRRFRRLGR